MIRSLLIICLAGPSIFGSPSIYARTSESMQEYRLCVNDLLKLRNRFDSAIPAWFGEIDRRFHHMRRGIEVIDTNTRLLEATTLLRERAPGSLHLSNHLVFNAIEDCRGYQKRYLSYAAWSVALIYFSIGTTAIIMLWFVFGGRRRKTPAPHDVRSRPDRSGQDKKAG